MKTLYLIGGPMGVGKTTVSQKLKKCLPRSVFLDGDWCWDAHPFQVTDETKAMVMDNIRHLLSNFLRCTAYENVVFCWVMHEQAIIDDILSALDVTDVRVRCISLVCDAEALIKRLQKDVDAGVRESDVIPRSLQRLSCYAALATEKVDTSTLDAQQVAEILAEK